MQVLQTPVEVQSLERSRDSEGKVSLKCSRLSELLTLWIQAHQSSCYQEARRVVQEAAQAAAEASLQEGRVLWRDVLRQEALRAAQRFPARLPICTHTESVMFKPNPTLSTRFPHIHHIKRSK